LRISVCRSGGFAGLRRERAVDTERLPPPEREAVEHLVIEARFFDLPERDTSGLPDVIHYRVRVELHGRSHEVATDERAAPDPLVELARRVLADAE